ADDLSERRGFATTQRVLCGRTVTLGVETLGQGACTYVARNGTAQTQFVGHFPIHAVLPGPNFAGTRVVSPTSRHVGIDLLGEWHVGDQRNHPLVEQFLDNDLAIELSGARELHTCYRVTSEGAWNAADALCRVV